MCERKSFFSLCIEWHWSTLKSTRIQTNERNKETAMKQSMLRIEVIGKEVLKINRFNMQMPDQIKYNKTCCFYFRFFL